jgi:anti-sigma factor RsiW
MSNRHPECEAIEPLLAPYGEPDCQGVLTDADRARICAHLAACPACRAEAEASASACSAVRAHAARLAGAAPPLLARRCRTAAARAAAPRRAARFAGWTALAAAAAAVLFIMINPAQAIATQLAVDHMKCAKFGVASAMTGSPAQLERAWLERRDQSVTIPPGNAGSGLALVGLRRCFSTDGGVAHVMYEQEGQPVSLFILSRDGAAGRAAPRQLEAAGHKAILWTTGPATYMLVGQSAGLAATAAWMQQQLEGRGSNRP